jgi:CubicO group peptidase (beta-lactamase class C family)
VTGLHQQLEAFRAAYGVPAVGGAVVTREGLTALAVVGVRVRGGSDPVDADDRWHLGSCGKAVTAVLYARLVERGEAEWGAPLTALFPDLAGIAAPGWSEVTIDDVFVSQAGLPANLARAVMKAARHDARPLPEQRTAVAAEALTRPPHRPGRFCYSNLGYVVAGAAIERITGLAFESALVTHVLEPLGLTSSGFGPPPELWGHEGRVVALGPLGLVDLGRPTRPGDPARVETDNPPVLGPAGRLHLSLADWSVFQQLFLTGGSGLVRPETIDRLLTVAPGRGQRQALGWAPARGLEGVALGQQGSNLLWVATALMDDARERTAMVVSNAGSARLLRQTARLAAAVLTVV